MKTILALIFCCTLASCNSFDQRVAKEAIEHGKASIQGSVVKGNGSIFGPKKTMFWVTHIDGEEIKERGYFRTYEIEPGLREIGVGGGTTESQFASTKSLGGESKISIKVEKGHNYEIRGSVNEFTVSLYAYDLTADKPVSETTTTDGHFEEQTRPILILIPIL